MPRLTDAKMPYDRAAVTPGILHFGVGQFCRAHLFHYTHRLMAMSAKDGKCLDWGIVGVNVLNGDREREMWTDFKKQNHTYSLTLFPHVSGSATGAAEPETTVVGSMIDYIYAPEEQDRLLRMLVDPRIRIVSMTVTEGGYNIDENTNEFDLTNATVRADLACPRSPKTTFGLIVEGLRRRRDDKQMPFTVMSCDNLRHNGNVAKKAILGYARAVDGALATWIEANVQFPNSMVDRITPATTPEMKRRLQSLPRGCSDDEQPVIGESFAQWVLEDTFVANMRPAWETVGLELTADVSGFEHTKVRILNSSHLFLAFVGLLLGHRTVHEALADRDLHQLVVRSLDLDVLPTLTSPMDKEAYKNTIIARFSNAAIADQLLRVAGDGTSKVQVFWAGNVLAVLERAKQMKSGKRSEELGRLGYDQFAFGLAGFLMYLHGTDIDGKTFPVIEPKLAPDTWKQMMQGKRQPMPSDDKAMMAFNAFDPWRSMPGRQSLEQRILFFYHAMREKGVRESMQLISGWQAEMPGRSRAGSRL